MFAATGLTQLSQRRVGRRADHEHAAVLDVGRENLSGWHQQRVVGVVQVARSGARNAWMSISVDDVTGRGVDHADREIVLLGDDHSAAVGREERVVGQFEGLSGAQVAGRREAPQDRSGRTHLEQAVVVAIRDQHGAGQDRWV